MFEESEVLRKLLFLGFACVFWNHVSGMPQYETGLTNSYHDAVDPSVLYFDQLASYSSEMASHAIPIVTDNSTDDNAVEGFETATINSLPAYNSAYELDSVETVTTNPAKESTDNNEVNGMANEVELKPQLQTEQNTADNAENFNASVIQPVSIDQESSGVSETSSGPTILPLVPSLEEPPKNDVSPINVPVENNPSALLIPLPPGSEKAPDIPREPESGQLPESPEPHIPLHPINLHHIPISLISLSGNSGGSNSDVGTYIASSTNNVPVDFAKFRYHVVTGQLLKIGSTGPGVCPPNMRFFAVPGHPKNGACDCDYYQCSRPLIYSPEKHQCYWAWSQGPCADGEWFVFETDLRRRGKCEINSCTNAVVNGNETSDINTEYFFQNPSDKTCLQAGTNGGHCDDQDERLLMYPGEPIPKCRKFTVCYPLTVPQELQCIYGNKYFVESGQCQ